MGKLFSWKKISLGSPVFRRSWYNFPVCSLAVQLLVYALPDVRVVLCLRRLKNTYYQEARWFPLSDIQQCAMKRKKRRYDGYCFNFKSYNTQTGLHAYKIIIYFLEINKSILTPSSTKTLKLIVVNTGASFWISTTRMAPPDNSGKEKGKGLAS